LSLPFTQYFSGNKIEKNEKEGAVARVAESRRVYRVLVGKPGRRRPLGRPRRKWEDNTRAIRKSTSGGLLKTIRKKEKYFIIYKS
jgi:hypothetical protein